MKLAHCQLGFRPHSLKRLTLTATDDETKELPEKIPFYLRALFDRIPRKHSAPDMWKGELFRWPFDLEKGTLKIEQGKILYQGVLSRVEGRWGPFWQGDFSDFTTSGNFQIETDYASTFPICIDESIYDRVQRCYLNYLYCQRSGFDIPGVRSAQHLDDAVLDVDGTQIDAVGGWYDAGDYRKWLFLTQPNLNTLAALAERGHEGLRKHTVDEIRWGSRYFQKMITNEGRVWEDVGAGDLKPGLDIEKDWWYENHPGCNCNGSDSRETDNVPNSGDERKIRTHYNPAVQYMFIRTQCRISALLPRDEARVCLALAEKAWSYGQQIGHEQQTLFIAEELWAAVELLKAGSTEVTVPVVEALVHSLLQRQDKAGEGLRGYFKEADGDGFRCIALACEPLMALLRLVEVLPVEFKHLLSDIETAVEAYIDDFLLSDANSNAFGLTPYGVYANPPHPDHQCFRDAGGGMSVRTFIHPFSEQQIVHGTGGVVLHQAVALAKAGALFGRVAWKRAAENLIQWTLGHNPESLSLHTGIGYEHPTPFSAHVTQLPDAMCVGHIGRPDDSPYLETSPLIEWSSQEIWDIPNAYLTEAILYL